MIEEVVNQASRSSLLSLLFLISTLQKNLVLTFVWLLIKNIYSYSSRLSFVAGEEEPEGSFAIFLFSFLIVYLINSIGLLGLTFTFDFWAQFYQLELTYFWWLPSMVSILILEISSLAAPKQKESQSPLFQETIFKGKKITSFYLVLTLILLIFSWSVLLIKNWQELSIEKIF